MAEPREIRLKRLHMRSIRRGIKEMDLILTAFSERELAGMSDVELDIYDEMLSENDQDLYQWVTGQVAPAEQFSDIISKIKASLLKD